jgi:hypothetical protein
VVSLHEQKLEACSAEQGAGGAEEAACFRVARPVEEVAQGEECVAALLDGALDQAAQMPSVTVQVAEDEQPAHSSRAYPAHPCLPRRSSKARNGVHASNRHLLEDDVFVLLGAGVTDVADPVLRWCAALAVATSHKFGGTGCSRTVDLGGEFRI